MNKIFPNDSFEPTLQNRLQDAEDRYALAETRLAQARTPIGRIVGRVGLWAARGDQWQAAQEFEIADTLSRLARGEDANLQ